MTINELTRPVSPEFAAEDAANHAISSITFTFFDIEPITVEASYFRIQNGRITAMDADLAPVASFSEAEVATIRARATEHGQPRRGSGDGLDDARQLRQIGFSLLVGTLACGWFFLTSDFDLLPMVMGACLLVGATVTLLISGVLHWRAR